MANIKSAKKRAITNEKSRLRNKAIKTNLKTVEKQFNEAVVKNDAELAMETSKKVSKSYDMAASKGIVHKNVANRKKAQVAKKVNALG